MQIHGLQKLTLLDYPGQTACTVFTGGCNMRCPFCHNATLVLDPNSQPLIDEEEVFTLLEKRAGILDGVAITGGEPLIQPHIVDFLQKLRAHDVLIKLDTNGSRPEALRAILEQGLVDHVAMDIKAAPENYPKVVGVANFDVGLVKESVTLLLGQLSADGVPYCSSKTGKPITFEFRTTVVEELHSAEDFVAIAQWISGAPQYFLQAFKDSGDIMATANTDPQDYHAPRKETLLEYLAIMQSEVPQAQLRGVD